MQKIRKNDDVMVISGQDRGKRGTVLRMLKHGRILVSGVNMVKKHTKPNPNLGIQGGIIDKEAPIHVSNVAIFNPNTNKPDRVGFKYLEDNKKVRIYKSDKEVIDV